MLLGLLSENRNNRLIILGKMVTELCAILTAEEKRPEEKQNMASKKFFRKKGKLVVIQSSMFSDKLITFMLYSLLFFN